MSRATIDILTWARKVGVSESTARRAFHKGKIPGAYRVGRLIRIPVDSVLEGMPPSDVCNDIIAALSDIELAYEELGDRIDGLARGQANLGRKLDRFLKEMEVDDAQG